MALTTRPKASFPAGPIGFMSDPVLHGVEKATQTYKKGAPLIDDDAGRITESTSPVNASAVANRVFGMAMNDATGVTGGDVAFVWIGPNTRIELTLSDSTAGTHTLAQGDQWRVFPFTKDPTFSTGFWYADALAVSDTGGIIIVEFKDPIGTVDARVYGIFTNTVRGGANAASGTY